jgi:tetratricopeptide (TPR) repeat protein
MFCSVAQFAQGAGNPRVTGFPGGFFAMWDAPVDISAVQLDKKLTGPFEVMFDVPSVDFVVDVLDSKSPSGPSPDMVMILTDYWTTRGKSERAIPLYEESLKQGTLDKEKTLIFQNNLAMLYSQALNQHDKALSLVKDALESNKDSFVLLDTKGLIYMNSGSPAEAVPDLTRAVELSCQQPIYCMHLACALHQTDRTTQARRWFDQARAQFSDDAVSKMAKENKQMFDMLQREFPPVGGE